MSMLENTSILVSNVPIAPGPSQIYHLAKVPQQNCAFSLQCMFSAGYLANLTHKASTLKTRFRISFYSFSPQPINLLKYFNCISISSATTNCISHVVAFPLCFSPQSRAPNPLPNRSSRLFWRSWRPRQTIFCPPPPPPLFLNTQAGTIELLLT